LEHIENLNYQTLRLDDEEVKNPNKTAIKRIPIIIKRILM